MKQRQEIRVARVWKNKAVDVEGRSLCVASKEKGVYKTVNSSVDSDGYPGVGALI